MHVYKNIKKSAWFSMDLFFINNLFYLFLLFIFIYLFIWLHKTLVAACGI